MTSLREIKLLKNLKHPNIASLVDMTVSYTSEKKIQDVYMVFQYMDHDLTGLLENKNVNFKSYIRKSKILNFLNFFLNF